MVRATHGMEVGAYYFEVTIKAPCIKSFPSNDGPHYRIGWSRAEADVRVPVGFDRYSYGYRDVNGDAVTLSKPTSYGEPYGLLDVIGCYIYIPERTEPPIPPKEHKENFTHDDGKEYVILRYEQVEEVAQDSCIIFFKNGKCQGVAFENLVRAKYYPAVSIYMGGTAIANFGLSEFKYMPDLSNVPKTPQAMSSLYCNETDLQHHWQNSNNPVSSPRKRGRPKKKPRLENDQTTDHNVSANTTTTTTMMHVEEEVAIKVESNDDNVVAETKQLLQPEVTEIQPKVEQQVETQEAILENVHNIAKEVVQQIIIPQPVVTPIPEAVPEVVPQEQQPPAVEKPILETNVTSTEEKPKQEAEKVPLPPVEPVKIVKRPDPIQIPTNPVSLPPTVSPSQLTPSSSETMVTPQKKSTAVHHHWKKAKFAKEWKQADASPKSDDSHMQQQQQSTTPNTPTAVTSPSIPLKQSPTQEAIVPKLEQVQPAVEQKIAPIQPKEEVSTLQQQQQQLASMQTATVFAPPVHTISAAMVHHQPLVQHTVASQPPIQYMNVHHQLQQQQQIQASLPPMQVYQQPIMPYMQAPVQYDVAMMVQQQPQQQHMSLQMHQQQQPMLPSMQLQQSNFALPSMQPTPTAALPSVNSMLWPQQSQQLLQPMQMQQPANSMFQSPYPTTTIPHQLQPQQQQPFLPPMQTQQQQSYRNNYQQQ